MRKKGGEYDYNNEKQYLYAKHSFRFETQCCLLNSSQKVAYTVEVDFHSNFGVKIQKKSQNMARIRVNTTMSC